MTPEEFAHVTGTPPDRLGRLRAYADALVRWQRAINLVAPATLQDLWARHMLDSAQCVPLLPPGWRRLADLGSGGGFPGLVVAILTDGEVHLVESDRRKAAFLCEAARAAGASVTVHAERIEAVPALAADVVTARALASLDRLLELAVPHLAPHGTCLFLKGARAAAEIREAEAAWRFDVEQVPSRTEPDAAILRVRGITRR